MSDVEFLESDQKGREIMRRRRTISETASPVVRWTMKFTGFSKKHAKYLTNGLVVALIITMVSLASVYYFQAQSTPDVQQSSIKFEDV